MAVPPPRHPLYRGSAERAAIRAINEQVENVIYLNCFLRRFAFNPLTALLTAILKLTGGIF